MPAADSVRSTSADSDLIWLGGLGGGDTRVDCASRALVRIEFAAPVPTAVRARSTSAEVSLQLGADIGGDRQQRLLRGAGAGLDGLAGVDHEVGQRAFRILDVGLDAERQFFGARHQAVAGLPAAALDAAGHGFDARAEQVLELRDAHVDVAGDRADPGFDALMDFLEPRRDGVGQMRRCGRRWSR